MPAWGATPKTRLHWKLSYLIDRNALRSVHVYISNPQDASHLSIQKMPHTSVCWHVFNFKMVLNESRANCQGMFHNGGPFGVDCI